MNTRLIILIACGLPLTLTAQSRRPIYSDAEYAARAQQASQAQPSAQQQEHNRQQMIVQDLQCLQNTTRVLQQSFAGHCKQRRLMAGSPEFELLGVLADLQEDVDHLANDILGRNRAEQVDLAHLYRSFHMVEYSAENSQTVAYQAGYGRSLSEYFQDIDRHIEALGVNGLRNPRLKRIEMDSRYGGRFSGQDRQIALPPVPAVQQPAVVPGTDPRQPGVKTIDLGDLFGRLFGKKR